MTDEQEAPEQTAPLSAQQILQAQIVAVAIIASPLIYTVVCVLLQQFSMPPGEGFVFKSSEVSPLIGVACAGLGVFLVVAAFYMRSFLERQNANPSLEGRMRTMMICMAIAEQGGVLGIVYFLLSGRLPEALVTFAIAFVGSALLFPTRDWLTGESAAIRRR